VTSPHVESSKDMDFPLEGFRVLDLSRVFAAPLCAQVLADFGAEVIKVEHPGRGDDTRDWGTRIGKTETTYYNSMNRNKRSITVDLKNPQGIQLIHDLLPQFDVVVHNFKTGGAEKLGLGYETLKAIKPDLVYCAVAGYDSSGPEAKRPGYDLVIQAEAGLMALSGEEGAPPLKFGIAIVDLMTGMHAAQAVLAALLHRERTGEGQLVRVNMLDAIVTLQMQELSVFTVAGKPQQRSAEPHAHVYIRAPYGVFQTRDGYITLAFPPLKKLGEAIGDEWFLDKDDDAHAWAHRDEIFARTRERLKTRTSREWLAIFGARDIWAGPVLGYDELLVDPQILHNGTFIEYVHKTEGRIKAPGFPYKFSKTPAQVTRGAPLVGEHTWEVLREAGYSDARIDALLRANTIRSTDDDAAA